MIHQKLIKKFKLTPDDLRAIFTCEDSNDPRHAVRKKFEKRVNSRVLDGVARRVKTADMYRAVDMAWDSQPIQKWQLPLLLYAQGKIKLDTLAAQLNETQCADQFLRKDGDRLVVDMPRLYEVSINLIRSYTTRRLAAQCARFSDLWPYFNYEPRGTDDVAKLRGEMTSQRVEVMSDAYNYRHFWPQTYRHMLLYGHSVAFPRCGWDVRNAWRLSNPNDPDSDDHESYVEREGVDFVAPHPSRVYWDTAHPLANINTDTGPRYIGYWDIVRYRDIVDGEGYFNVDKVSYGTPFAELLVKQGSYFNYYFDPTLISATLPDLALNNDRGASIGIYSATTKDSGCLLTQHFECINPKREGMSELNMDVWLRLTVAGDDTIVGAEVMPSRPAVYGGHNENDDREVNISMAMELMPFQDQLSNLLSQMLMSIKTGMMQIWCIDKDALDPEMQKYIEAEMQGNSLYTEPKAFFYSGAKLRNLGLQTPDANPRAFLQIIQANVQQSIDSCMSAMAKLLNLADRVIVVSPNEVGQPNERTISAREVTEIAQTTNSIQSFISDGLDEQRAAVKKLLFESLICCSTQTYRLAAINRYTKATIKKAGFSIEGDSDALADNVPMEATIVGNVSNLIYDYYFDTRDGAERATNAQTADALGRLMGQVLQVPELASAVGKKRIFEMLNEVFRLSGAGYDLKMEDGEGEEMPQGEDRLAALEKVVRELVAMVNGSGTTPLPDAGDPSPDGGLPPALQEPMAAGPELPPGLPPGENLQPVLAG